jgi:cell division protein FtsI (penicillin-binding protein 3)
MSPRYLVGRWVKVRLFFASGLLAACFGGIGYRTFVLQVRESARLKAMAEQQYLKDVEVPARRGRILDRSGAELAASAEVDSVYANPHLIGARAAQFAAALAGPLKMDEKELEKHLRSKKYYQWLKRRISPEEARLVRSLELDGIALAKEPRRYYPNRQLAGPVIGWAGLDSVGQEGIELQYDKQLRGTKSEVPALRDALNRAVLTDGMSEASAQAGNDVQTTIDRHIQFRLDQALDKAVTTHHAKAAVAVAIDPNNGEILAMSSVPTMNPNDPDDVRERGVRNRPVTDPFEPGSTMKTFSIAAAIEGKVVAPDEHWFCENGRYQVGPAVIHDDERIGDVTTTGVLAQSSNICATKIAERSGKERMRDMYIRMGFGKPTGVDLPGERSGQIRSLAKMGKVETATMSFGHGLTATPIQLATAYAAIANGGTLWRPHIVRMISDGNGNEIFHAELKGTRVVSEELTATMRKMLFAVTQKPGTAASLTIPGYVFAGKTGTAQKVDPATRHYSADKWASSFVGFAPLEHPQLLIYVMIDEPRGIHVGARVAGPVFQEVMTDALKWLSVPPSEPVEIVGLASTAAPTHAQKKADKAPPVIIETTDPVDAPDSPELEQVAAADRTDIPDFTGMTMGEAITIAAQKNLRLDVSGSGIATSQSPGPDRVRRGTAVRVSFLPPK